MMFVTNLAFQFCEKSVWKLVEYYFTKHNRIFVWNFKISAHKKCFTHTFSEQIVDNDKIKVGNRVHILIFQHFIGTMKENVTKHVTSRLTMNDEFPAHKL